MPDTVPAVNPYAPHIGHITTYENVIVVDGEGDKYASLRPSNPITFNMLDSIRKESNDRWKAIEEGDAEPETDAEKEAFDNGPQHYFIWLTCTKYRWDYSNSYTLTVDPWG